MPVQRDWFLAPEPGVAGVAEQKQQPGDRHLRFDTQLDIAEPRSTNLAATAHQPEPACRRTDLDQPGRRQMTRLLGGQLGADARACLGERDDRHGSDARRLSRPYRSDTSTWSALWDRRRSPRKPARTSEEAETRRPASTHQQGQSRELDHGVHIDTCRGQSGQDQLEQIIKIKWRLTCTNATQDNGICRFGTPRAFSFAPTMPQRRSKTRLHDPEPGL